MTSKPTLTIGIPAYNEARNIVVLLDQIAAQKLFSVELKEVIVASDGSSDATPTLVKAYKKLPIRLIHDKRRLGQGERQNQIFSKANSDVVVLLNADVRIQDPLFLEYMSVPIIKHGKDLTSSLIKTTKAHTFAGKMLNVSLEFKNKIYQTYKAGKNLYTCHGAARGFSKRLYTVLRFEGSVGEDAYSYLFATSKGMKYAYVPHTAVYIKSPESMDDHARQSGRFLQTHKKLDLRFGKAQTAKAFHRPFGLTIKTLLSFLLKHPIYMSAYVATYYGMKLMSLFKDYAQDTWSVSESSKRL